MIREARSYRERAINALFHLVGGEAKQIYPPNVPTALMLAHCGLAITAGDEGRPLDPFALKPFAAKHGLSVIATWTDRMLSGHAFEIDAVLHNTGTLDHYKARRLWVQPKRGAWLVAQDDAGPATAIDHKGVRLATHKPYRDKVDLLLGIAAGQALLQSLVFGGSPYARPLPQNLGR
ncbi:hypothetical protein [Sphingomonas sp. ABOLG]|uniref:hypothetical protein n=2 Tax=Sphingomonas TaxID=13687 RepID=UPI000F7D630C|nr:hypothetical protein [Sphingomonas sp. ABOLG]RSV19247.1 hypothetical protein CA236_04165 [Sphingomonas sp. ABOLG]